MLTCQRQSLAFYQMAKSSFEWPDAKVLSFLQMNVYSGNLVHTQWPSFTQTEKEEISFDKVTTHF